MDNGLCDSLRDKLVYQKTLDLVDEGVRELLIELLDRESPMKALYDHRYAEMGCAFCGEMVSGWEELPNYCPYCGQAIDWSEP
jgi:hypothetical protein